MDDADRAARSDEWIMRAAIEERKPEGPSPMLVTMCLFCGKSAAGSDNRRDSAYYTDFLRKGD